MPQKFAIRPNRSSSRIMEGILRFGGDHSPDFEACTSPLTEELVYAFKYMEDKQGNALNGSFLTLDILLDCWLKCGHASQLNPNQLYLNHQTIAGLTIFRDLLQELSIRVLEEKFGPVLSTPTHTGGWIDPRILVNRFNELLQLQIDPGENDFILSLLRLAPDFRRDALEKLEKSSHPFRLPLRYALGDDIQPASVDEPGERIWLVAVKSRYPHQASPDIQLSSELQTAPEGGTPGEYKTDEAYESEKRFFLPKTAELDWAISLTPPLANLKS
ncbi:MAG: DUF6493 family protein [Planctomycetaceae bacterium]